MKPASTAAPELESVSRGERRKRETRERLMQAAFRLFAERGVDAVPINEITEAADVGFGSFYNHFPSKEALHDALRSRVFEQFADALDGMASNIEDPAEVLAVSVRHALLRAEREPLWGKLLIRQSYQGDVIARTRVLHQLSRQCIIAAVSEAVEIADRVFAYLQRGSWGYSNGGLIAGSHQAALAGARAVAAAPRLRLARTRASGGQPELRATPARRARVDRPAGDCSR